MHKWTFSENLALPYDSTSTKIRVHSFCTIFWAFRDISFSLCCSLYGDSTCDTIKLKNYVFTLSICFFHLRIFYGIVGLRFVGLVAQKKIETLVDHDLEIDYPAEMTRIQNERRELLLLEKNSQVMLTDAFRGIGYAIEWIFDKLPPPKGGGFCYQQPLLKNLSLTRSPARVVAPTHILEYLLRRSCLGRV